MLAKERKEDMRGPGMGASLCIQSATWGLRGGLLFWWGSSSEPGRRLVGDDMHACSGMLLSGYDHYYFCMG